MKAPQASPSIRPTATAARSSSVHVDRLVLDGLKLHRHDAPGLQAALETELARLLAGATPTQRRDVSLASLPAIDLSWQPGSSPDRLGRAIAAALRQALGDKGLL